MEMSVCAGVLHVHYKQEMFQRVVLLPSGQVLVAGRVGGYFKWLRASFSACALVNPARWVTCRPTLVLAVDFEQEPVSGSPGIGPGESLCFSFHCMSWRNVAFERAATNASLSAGSIVGSFLNCAPLNIAT